MFIKIFKLQKKSSYYYIKMVNTYILVNPHIEGNFKRKIKATNSNEAANILYKSLAEHFNNSVPKFYFSIQKGSSGEGKYYHFQVTENRDNEEVNFNIKPYSIHGEHDAIQKFETKLNNFKNKFHKGGAKKKKQQKQSKQQKDSDSSDFNVSDDELYTQARSYLPTTQPIYFWWYDPSVYHLTKLYIPTFYSYVTPYLEISIDNSP
jgi:hypothetical protein